MRSNFDSFNGLGATIVAVSQDDAEDVNEYWKENSIPFLCLPDPEGKLKALYHQESKMGPLPALFVIGKNGNIVLAHYGKSMKDIPTAESLLALIKESEKTAPNEANQPFERPHSPPADILY